MPIGHRFVWFNFDDKRRFDDPPPDCKCDYCGQRFDQIENIHWCRVQVERAYAKNSA